MKKILENINHKKSYAMVKKPQSNKENKVK